ncbi:CGNR zinc finger domain-containing protein [Micromonospora sp. NPDC003776]
MAASPSAGTPDPCRAPYLDRTRAGRQRYCCELCNNRAAAAAYRSRSRRG